MFIIFNLERLESAIAGILIANEPVGGVVERAGQVRFPVRCSRFMFNFQFRETSEEFRFQLLTIRPVRMCYLSYEIDFPGINVQTTGAVFPGHEPPRAKDTFRVRSAAGNEKHPAANRDACPELTTRRKITRARGGSGLLQW